MTQWISQYIGLEGIKLHMAVAAVFAVILQLSVVIVGFLVNKLEMAEYRLLRRFKGHDFAIVFCNYVTFPGVILHELSHALLVKLTGGQVTKMRIFWPDKTGRLGYVNFTTKGSFFKRRLQLICASCAPVLMGYLYLYILYHVLQVFDLKWYVVTIIIYFMISIFNHMSMSNQDLENYIKGSIFLFPVLTVILFLMIYFTS